MSINSRPKLLIKLNNKRYRDAYVTEHVKTGIAFQIRALRSKKGLSQGGLADLAKTKQAVISRLEDPDYGKISLNSLYKLANALDVALLVKFVPYTKFLKDIEDVSPKKLAVNDFTEESNALSIWALGDTNVSEVTDISITLKDATENVTLAGLLNETVLLPQYNMPPHIHTAYNKRVYIQTAVHPYPDVAGVYTQHDAEWNQGWSLPNQPKFYCTNP